MTASSRRRLPEWIGRTPDTAIPPRVALRVVDDQGGRCAGCCGVFGPTLPQQIDHITALINGGENRQSNLRALCIPCHAMKTTADVALKSTVARKRGKHLGIVTRSKRPIGGWNARKFVKTLDGRVLDRATRTEITRR